MILDDVVLLLPSLQLLNVKQYFLWALFIYISCSRACSLCPHIYRLCSGQH